MLDHPIGWATTIPNPQEGTKAVHINDYVLPVGLHLDDTLGDALGLSESREEFGNHM
jgi:hypothetical protein